MTTARQERHRIIVIDDTMSIHEDFRKTLGARTSQRTEAAFELARQEEDLFGTETEAESPGAEYEIDSAMQGQEGSEMVRRAVAENRPYAVAFVDMRMPPGWDGLQTIERLWQEDPNLQVVICTAYSDYSWSDITRRVGVTDKLLILKKPFEHIEVSQIAMALCEKWAMTRAACLKLNELEALVEQRTAKLRYAATHDRLTGLANRDYLIKRLRQTLSGRNRADGYALLCLDFDRFKLINDSLGHDMGDLLLQQIADRLRGALPEGQDSAFAARMGGDEFLILLDPLAHLDRATEIAESLLEAFRKPYDLKGRQVYSTASIGVTTSEMDYVHAQDMLRHADIAMYRAKSGGRNRYALFDRTMHDEVVNRIEMEELLRHAVENGMIDVHYQPIVSVADGRLLGMEALARLKGLGDRSIGPGDFIPLVEELGLIHEFGDVVLRRSLTALRRWQQMNPDLHSLYMNVNLSKHQLVDSAITSRIAAMLRETGVDPNHLQLEITESVIMGEPEVFAERIREIKGIGARIAMDDFGTGLSSLACLRKFPLDTLKIDRSFICSVSGSLEYAAIVQAIVTLADNLRMQVVAEGIETQPQLVLIQAMDCHAAQGYLFSEPRDEAYWDQRLGSHCSFANAA